MLPIVDEGLQGFSLQQDLQSVTQWVILATMQSVEETPSFTHLAAVPFGKDEKRVVSALAAALKATRKEKV